jgi:hypothetical protein
VFMEDRAQRMAGTVRLPGLEQEPSADSDSGTCVDMTWVAKARARHRLESGSSESRDSDVSEARPVAPEVPLGIFLPNRCGLPERTLYTGPRD